MTMNKQYVVAEKGWLLDEKGLIHGNILCTKHGAGHHRYLAKKAKIYKLVEVKRIKKKMCGYRQ